jgi:hypothetical protein
MNSLYTSGVRQTNSIQIDLDRLRAGESTPALIGEQGFPIWTTGCVVSYRVVARAQTYTPTRELEMPVRLNKFSDLTRANKRLVGCYESNNRRLRFNGQTGNYQGEAGEGSNVRVIYILED